MFLLCYVFLPLTPVTLFLFLLSSCQDQIQVEYGLDLDPDLERDRGLGLKIDNQNRNQVSCAVLLSLEPEPALVPFDSIRVAVLVKMHHILGGRVSNFLSHCSSLSSLPRNKMRDLGSE